MENTHNFDFQRFPESLERSKMVEGNGDCGNSLVGDNSESIFRGEISRNILAVNDFL